MKKFLSIIILFWLITACDQIKVSDIQKSEAGPVADLAGNNTIVIYIIESNIVSEQLVGVVEDKNFVHNKVLRGALNADKTKKLDSLITETNLNDSIQTKRVLLEYFTGHKCGNCPIASKPVFEEIEKLYQNTVNIVKIHASSFANTSASYPTNYKTSIGDALLVDFGITSMPIGLVNRVNFPNYSKLLSTTDWLAKIETEIKLPAEFGIWENHTLDVNNNVKIIVKIKDLKTKKIYGSNFNGNLLPEWKTANCQFVVLLLDPQGNVLQSIEKNIL